MDLADLLDFEASEHVAFVGAGGKKTAMHHLVESGRRRGRLVGYTTTTRMPPPASLDLLIAEGDGIQKRLLQADGSVAFAAREIENPARAEEKVSGHDTDIIDEIYDSRRFDWLLVKADGARRRAFKAPGLDEPVIPRSVTHVIPFASVTVIGNSLDEETVHRPARVAEITDTGLGEDITPRTVAAVFASPRGALKRVPASPTVTPVLNKADTPARRETARHTVGLALSQSEQFEKGLVTSFRSNYAEVVTA